MNPFEKFLQTKGYTLAQFEGFDETKQAGIQNEYLGHLETQIESLKTSNTDVTALKAEIETLKTGAVTTEQVAKLEQEIKVLQDAMVKEAKPETLFDEVKSKKDEIIKLVKGEVSEVVLKADTTRASITSSASQNLLSGIGQLGVKVRGLYDLFRKVNLSTSANDAGKVVYHDWDEDTTVRAAAMMAEGGTFPESTAKFAKYSIDLKKIGDTLPVSEEFGEDEASAAAELEMFLETNVESKVDAQIATGDGTGQNLTGLYTSAPAYTAAASGISDANIYDLVKKVRTDITFNRGSKYRPNFVAMNDNMIDKLQLKKDANDNYIFPDKTNIGSMIIVSDNNLADNTLVVGDSRYATIYEKGGVTLERVYVNAQAIEDMQTIKARKRMLLLIRNVDKTGFRKVTSVSAALATLAT